MQQFRVEVERKRKGPSKVWVLVVLVVGILLGILLTSMQTDATTPWRGQGRGGGFQLETPDDVDIILSTVSIVLLFALLVVYMKILVETKANFALGLVFVFLALLFQSILTSPLVYGALGQSSGGLGIFLVIADLFKIAAFTVFLYLSLE